MSWSAVFCPSRSTRDGVKVPDLSFHAFPRPGRKDREKWIKFVRNNRSEETWLPSVYTNLCSLHFREEDKYATKAGRRFLKKSAVPCIDDSSSVSENPKSVRKTIDDVTSAEDSLVAENPISMIKTIERIKFVSAQRLKKVKFLTRKNRNLEIKTKKLMDVIEELKKLLLSEKE